MKADLRFNGALTLPNLDLERGYSDGGSAGN